LLSRFFISRPIFAIVIAICVSLAGALAIFTLPINQYPNIALPQINVSASYSGASAKVVEDGVTQILEQGMNGIDNLKYLTAQSSSGSSNVTLYFEAGTDPDKAQIQVQNQVQSRLRLLPQDVQTQGVRVNKSNTSFLMVFSFYTEDNSMSNDDIGDFIYNNIQDPISRVNGVGGTRIFGSQHAMRIWLNPSQLQNYSLVPADVINAIRNQNVQVASGSLADNPATNDVGYTALIKGQSRFKTPEEFENIIVKNFEAASPIYLRDVARVEIGADNYGVVSKLNGHRAAGIAINLANGANALKTADEVTKKIKELEPRFPQKIKYAIPNDSTQFVKISIKEVVITLIEAVILVFVVMFIFLQSWRATLIPAIAVPVVLLGTFGILAILGYSINTLTMFGIVLAIGLLVDDAIVVVENVERLMHEEKLDVKDATIKSMDTISGALIGVAAVLAAMFFPMAFFGGTQGVIYRQFSVTLISAMGLSVLVALILTPPLCIMILRPQDVNHAPKSKFSILGGFEAGFQKFAQWYQKVIAKILYMPFAVLGVYAIIFGAMILLALKLPSSFLPTEDQGMIQTQVQLPTGTTSDKTQIVVDKVKAFYEKQPGVKYIFATTGGGPGSTGGQNSGSVIARMAPIEERKSPDTKVFAIVEKAKKEFAKYTQAQINPTIPPAVRELGNASGFSFVITDMDGQGNSALLDVRSDILASAAASKLLSNTRSNAQDNAPQLNVEIDKPMAGALGVSLADVNSLMSNAMTSTYVNDYIDKGRIKRVYVQGDAPYRMRPQDLMSWHVRNNKGEMIPLSAFCQLKWGAGAPRLDRYNGLPSVEIQGTPAQGVSNGDAMVEIEKILKELPDGYGYNWTGISLQEKEVGSQAPLLYGISIVFIFLLLAALYESWSVPFAVILVIPLGVFGAFLATYLRGLDKDIFFQVGLLATMGLSAKNAILIVEFAKNMHDSGKDLIHATKEAVRIRLRPIIMTSLAFTFGIFPLVIASSAGAKAQNAIGTGLFGGVIAATFLAIFFVPLFFVLVTKLFSKAPKGEEK
jgi:hydrophobe/amphiphile efflux-1 (HAE1) family protein